VKRALLVSYLSTHFIELQRVARILAASGKWEPVFHFARPYPESGANAAAAKADGWSWTSTTALPEASAASAASLAPSSHSTIRSTFRALPAPVKRLARWTWFYPRGRRRYRLLVEAASKVLRGHSLLVLAEDNVDYRTSVFVRAGHDAGIPSVIVPFTVANALEPAEAYFDNEPRQLTGIDEAFARRHPQWVFEHRGRKLLRLPAAEALATEHLGLAPPLPWILHSGRADAIAVESDAMLEHYRACGIPEKQLVVTGALYDDALAAALRNAPALRSELGLDEHPVILCALPPDQIPGREDRVEFPTYEALARHWITTLTATGHQVVVSLHPRTPRESMRFLQELGARIPSVDVAQLLPLCDLFVASVSATIRMAIACGKPVVNYDVYRYRYTDYVSIPGVTTMEDRAGFESTIRRLTSDPAVLAAAAAPSSTSSRWGRLDGRAAARMLALFDRLTEKSA